MYTLHIATHSENDLPIRKCGLNILKIPPIVYYWITCGWSLRMRSLLLLLSILFYVFHCCFSAASFRLRWDASIWREALTWASSWVVSLIFLLCLFCIQIELLPGIGSWQRQSKKKKTSKFFDIFRFAQLVVVTLFKTWKEQVSST